MDPPWRRCRPCPPPRRRRPQSLLQGRRWLHRPYRRSVPHLPPPRSPRLQPSLPRGALPLQPFRLPRCLQAPPLPPPPRLRPHHQPRLRMRGRRHLHPPLPLPPRKPHRLLNLQGRLKPLQQPSLLRPPNPLQRSRRRLRCRSNRPRGRPPTAPLRRRPLTALLRRSLHPNSLRSSTSRCWSPWRRPRRVAQRSGQRGRPPSFRSLM